MSSPLRAQTQCWKKRARAAGSASTRMPGAKTSPSSPSSIGPGAHVAGADGARAGQRRGRSRARLGSSLRSRRTATARGRGDHGNETGYGEAFYILTLWDKLVKAGMRPTRSAVNLGANDGISGDPTFELFERGWSGLAVEPSKKSGLVGFIERPLWERLWENLPWDRVVKDDTPVTPDNVVALFDRAKLPLDLDVLKIDLDSYDIFVVERVLLHSRYRPKIIVMEISEGARKRERTRETDAGRVRASRSLSLSLTPLSFSLSRARRREDPAADHVCAELPAPLELGRRPLLRRLDYSRRA